MKNKIIIYTILISFIVGSCNDYLDVEPIGKLIPTKLDEFDRLLNGGDYSLHTTSDEESLFFSADDTDPLITYLGDISSPDNLPIRYIKWERDLFPLTASVELWNKPYENIYTYNYVIENVKNAIGNDEEARARITAEARIMRAYEYYILINGFAKQYDISTANTDLGVPIVTIPDVLAEDNVRATVQEVYDLIIEDLNESVNDLPLTQEVITRPDKATGYGLLARVYLQMNDYENAKTNADLALNIQGTLSDYTSTSGYGLGSLYNEEQYMYRYFGSTYGFNAGTMSLELQALYTADDIRSNGIYNIDWRGNLVKSFYTYSNHCVSVSEMYVIRAECNARLAIASVQDVLDDLNMLRSHRIINNIELTTADLPTKEDALVFALEERRREMIEKGTRWFDLKRLNKETAFSKTLTHEIDGETLSLEPNSNKYVFPIPPETMNFNPNMEQNIRE